MHVLCCAMFLFSNVWFFHFRKSSFLLYLARNTFEFSMKKWQKDTDASTTFASVYITHTTFTIHSKSFCIYHDKIFIWLNMTKSTHKKTDELCCIHWIQTKNKRNYAKNDVDLKKAFFAFFRAWDGLIGFYRNFSIHIIIAYNVCCCMHILYSSHLVIVCLFSV